ncbi:MAG: polysaccharide biosynthesis/export family protein [Desulfamplus sp.]|nr:polysaccharide biosynthesis/export family protein [Desulfamplus sp.]
MFIFLICSCVMASNAFAAESVTALHAKNSQFMTYRIGKGDILRVLVWKEPDLSIESAIVRLDGKITLPLIDDVQAEGLSTMELKYIIESTLGKFVEAPLVTVILLEPASQKYYILGEIEKVGEYPITKKMTVMQAFTVAGGFTEWAAKKEIILFRIVDGKEKITRINYKDIIKGKDFKYNVTIQADDIIIVP